MTPSPERVADAAALPTEPAPDRFRRVLRRRRRLILGLALLGALLGAIAGLLVTPRYAATALVLLEASASPDAVPDAPFVETQLRLIASPGHTERVVAYLDAADMATLAVPRADRLALLGDAARRQLLAWIPPAWLVAVGLAEEPPSGVGMPDAATASPADAVSIARALAERLEVRQEGRSAVIAIGFRATDPETAARIANLVAEAYVATRTGQGRGAGGPDTWLAQLQAEADAAEAALERFRLDHEGGAVVEGDDAQRLAGLEAELAEAQAELARREARLDGVRAFRADRAAAAPPAEVATAPGLADLLRQEAELLQREAELAATYGERHPRRQLLRVEREELSAEIERQLEAIAAGLGREAAVAAEHVAAVEAELEAARSARAEAEAAATHLAELERAAAESRQLYETARQRQVAPAPDEASATATRLIAPAMPPTRPSTPGLPLMAAMGLVASTTLATLLALVIERLDQGLRSERDVLMALGLPRIGVVPELEARVPPHAYLLRRPLSAYAESMRAILAGLHLQAEPGRLPRLILVTSSLPGEGKTTLAVSLATYAARSGRRTLLLDLDLRHPKVDHALQLRTEAGIVEHLLGNLPLDQVVARDPQSGLDMIAVRERAPDPMPLLEGPRLGALLELLRDRYDHVLIDSPPLLGIIDAQVLAPRVDAVLLAVRWGRTARGPVQSAVRLLRAARAPLAGVVLTRVDLKKHASYGYGDVGDYYASNEKYYVN